MQTGNYMSGDVPNFGAVTRFDGREATVALRGNFESIAAGELRTILDAAIDRSPTSMVLDLTALDYMGAAGLVVVSDAEKRLGAFGTTLKVRTSSDIVNLFASMVEIVDTPRFEERFPNRTQENMTGMVVNPLQPRSSGSSANCQHVTSPPTYPDVVDGVLRLVVDLARSCVHGADGVSVSLLRNGELSTAAASDQTIMAMDAEQYATREGPCVDASLKGRWFHAESLDTEIRWPSFTPKARVLGIRAILSSPLTALEAPVGALNIYSRTASSFDVDAQETAAVFAQKVSEILRVDVNKAQMEIRFQEALRSREVISLAKGVIMEREGLGEDSAFSALLRLAAYRGTPLRQRAEEMVLSADPLALKPEGRLND
jgi:anti-anti-sigma factor